MAKAAPVHPKRVLLLVGAHKTASTHLQRAIAAQKDVLRELGIGVLEPNDVRRFLAPLSYLLRDYGWRRELTHLAVASAGAVCGFAPETLVVMDENILGATEPRMLWSDDGRFYPWGPGRTARTAELFPRSEISVGLALRDLGTFLPSAYGEAIRNGALRTWEGWLGGIDPTGLRWSPTAKALSDAVAPAPLTVWRFEDYPQIAPVVLDRLLGENAAARIPLPPEPQRVGLSADAIGAVRRHLEAGGDPGDRGALERAMRQHPRGPDAPGFRPFNSATLEWLTEAYRQDVDAIAALPRTTVLAP
ncbi:hypothetical protein RM543_14015 [Roseicyclus sp. F158]|uniref:Uncharacterized protein n=1 Tax=Tropicimonas omnivorans TaxID=3075590 RepID=A0ABU3DJQ1_9RHOB|nr:hypothetical protein [Roseicyclus sp. F158]MDT0683803.1 hypothetical protein [Roseicyclus sp. F158]